MRAKKEKTEFGTVQSVVPRKKKAYYGEVEPPKEIHGTPKDEAPDEGMEGAMSGSRGEGETEAEQVEADTPMESKESGEAKEEAHSLMEKMMELAKSMEDYSKQKAEEKAKKEEESQESDETEEKEPKSEEEKQEEQAKKKQDEQENDMTKYLNLQVKIRALGEFFGASSMAEVGKEYYSYCAVEGVAGYTVFKTPTASERMFLTLNPLPYFDTQDKAEAFLELCNEILLDYGNLAVNLKASAIASNTLKVIITPKKDI